MSSIHPFDTESAHRTLRRTILLVCTFFVSCGGDDGGGDRSSFSRLNGTGSWRSIAPLELVSTDNFGTAFFTAVWAGDSLITWGGLGDCGTEGACAGGLRYWPATDSWSEISSTGAPSGRVEASGIWSGDELIVWGGALVFPTAQGERALGDGGAYDPETDSWRSIADLNAPESRSRHLALWIGEEMIVWGGSRDATIASGFIDTGARYHPISDMWTPMATAGAPAARVQFDGTWTGTEVIVWGGETLSAAFTNTGGIYTPENDTWRPTSMTGAPSARVRHATIWTGEEVVIVGGLGCSPCDTRAYNPLTDTWRKLADGPTFGESTATAIWSGSEILVWHGLKANEDGRYDPLSDTWSRITEDGAPSRRQLATVLWTGEEMLVWAGSGRHGDFNFDGKLYAP